MSKTQRPPVLSIRYLPLSAIKPDPKNPRRHPAKQVEQIAASIQTFGFNVPVLLDGAGVLIAGHGRLQAAQLLRLQTVPTIRIDHLTPAQRRAFMVADNQLTINAEWDEALLRDAVADLQAQEFPTELLGFNAAELAALCAPAAEPEPEGPDKDKSAALDWVLISFPRRKWKEIKSAVEVISAVPGVKVETTRDGERPATTTAPAERRPSAARL